MKLVTVFLLLLMAIACSGQSPLPAPSPAPQPGMPPMPPAPVIPPRDMNVGETIEDVYGDGRTINPGEYKFFVTVPRTGTLTATLTWDPWYLGTVLKLTVAGQAFEPARPAYSPVIGSLPVKAGVRYPIVVSLYGADWLPQDRFQLTTRLEP